MSRIPLSVYGTGYLKGQSPKCNQRELGIGFGEMGAELYLSMIGFIKSKSSLRYLQLEPAAQLRKKLDW
jgi:hypothetical protein